MIRSMTGYGRGERRWSHGTVVAELRTVNHRHLEVGIRMPRELAPLEPAIKKRIQGQFGRGRLDLTVTVNGTQVPRRKPVVDITLARAYAAALGRLRETLGLRGEVDLTLLAGLRDVISVVEVEPAALPTQPVEAAVAAAIKQVAVMRTTEGRAIAKDMLKRLGLIERMLRQIEAQAPKAAVRHQARLSRRIEQLTGPGMPGGEGVAGQQESISTPGGRLAQELIAWADRSDISEEIQRLRSHLAQFRQMTAHPGADGAGKRLDFLLQEMNREVNTIGSKADDADIALQVVGMKSELEKIREQVQNVE